MKVLVEILSGMNAAAALTVLGCWLFSRDNWYPAVKDVIEAVLEI